MNSIRRQLLKINVPRLLNVQARSGGGQRLTWTHLSALYSTEVAGAHKSSTDAPITVSNPIGQEKKFDAKIVKLVDEIGKLTLIEVADLNELLKKTLNIPDTPMMGGMMMAAPQPSSQQEEVEEVVPVKVQTQFTVKLMKFDETKKVPLIKEVKALMEGMNLVQAKKFVESAPTTVKADLSKEDAEKLAAALTAVGGTCELV